MSLLNWLFGSNDESDETAHVIVTHGDPALDDAIPDAVPLISTSKDDGEGIWADDMTPEQKAEYGFVKFDGDPYPWKGISPDEVQD